MIRRLPFLLGVLSVFSAFLMGETPAPTGCTLAPQQPPQVAHGDDVNLQCTGVKPSQTMQVWVKGVTDQSTSKGMPFTPVVKQDGTFSFRVPDTTPAGQYSVSVAVSAAEQVGGSAPAVVPAQLDIMGKPVIDAIYALTNYPAPKGFDFEIAGKNLRKPQVKPIIEIVGLRILDSCPPGPPDPPAAESTPCGNIAVNSTSDKITVKGFYPRHFYGPIRIKVHVGAESSDPASVSFAPFTQQGVALGAALVFFVIAYVLFRLVQKGLTGDMVDGEKPSAFASLFLDRETNSYSLSKFQVVAWTSVTVYSYVYIFLCRTLIQGDFTFPDVSQNLPQLFFVSAGTTVAATAITANWGSKGAGSPQPSFSDFISTGGLVAGDRFQFFTWTLVGCIGYVYLVVRMNPETLNISLPDIPQNFLYLMGVSSAGYLGGKLVRKPGPVIKGVSVAKITPHPATVPPTAPAAAAAAPVAPVAVPVAAAAVATQNTDDPTDARTRLGKDYGPTDDNIRVALPALTLNLKGENLDPTGKIKIDDQALRGDMFWINGQPDPQTHLCSELTISLNDASQYIDVAQYKDGGHKLMLVNTDGQSATVTFPVSPMSIDPIDNQTSGNTAIDVTVNGKNFVSGTTAEWRNPAAAAEPATTTVTYLGDTKLKVNLIPGAAGTCKLTLVSPIGLRASANVTIGPKA